MTRASLREATGIAPATISKMSRGESVGANVLERICASMQCNIGDIVDYVPDVNRVPSGEGDKGEQAR
jgi:DNA-binding Xre family transcriptional regulator